MLSKSDYRYFKKAKMAATISDYNKKLKDCEERQNLKEETVNA